MTARRLVVLVLLAAVPAVCLTAVAGCRAAGPCGLIMTAGSSWWPVALGPPLLVVSIAIVWSSETRCDSISKIARSAFRNGGHHGEVAR